MESRGRLYKLQVQKWLCYTLLLLLGGVLQTVPGLLTVGTVKPLFILPVCMAVACCEGPYRGGWFAIVGGLLWDWTAGQVPGLLAIAMVVLCFAAAVVVELILRVNSMNFCMLTFVGSLVVMSLDFLFQYVMRGYADPGVEYLSRVVPVVVFTTAVSPPAMMLARAIRAKFDPEK